MKTGLERSLLGLQGISREEIASLLAHAGSLLPVVRGESPPLVEENPAVVGLLFFENSTRTRCSFEVAAYRLGHHPLTLTSSGSSISKGETLADTARTIDAMGVQAIVVRCSESGGAALIQEATGGPVINAGDGRNEHPTQGLLDALALQEHLGDLEGKTILIAGDIANSRVARSNIHGLDALGAQILLVGPQALVPESMVALAPKSVRVMHDIDEALPMADAVMALRVQRERGGGDAMGGDYRKAYGLTVERAARLEANVPVMHPGPSNRGVEIDDLVHDDPQRSLITLQVTCGVAVRMAIMQRALGITS